MNVSYILWEDLLSMEFLIKSYKFFPGFIFTKY